MSESTPPPIHHLSRCTKNKIRDAALKYFSADIHDYLTLKMQVSQEKDNAEMIKRLQKMDDDLSSRAFFFSIASECVMEGLENGFMEIESIVKEMEAHNDSSDSK